MQLNSYIKKFMQIAVHEGYKNLGNTYSNPSVGAVLVKDGKMIAKAHTGDAGSPHAEYRMLEKLTLEQTKDTDLFVTLEPCAHHGKNPPCTDKIIAAGIKNVYVGAIDPHPLVVGKGRRMLESKGIKVKVLSDPDAIELHKGFFHYARFNKPYITCKLATTIDGKIALTNNISKWITSEDSRKYVHLLRSRYDAIMTGVGTINTDDPFLNSRLPGITQEKNIIVVDRQLKISLDANVVKNCAKSPLWIITTSNDADKIAELENRGVKVFCQQNFAELKNVIAFLAKRNITSIFCEAGSLVSKLVKERLVDQLIIFRAAKIFGNDAKPLIEDLGIYDVGNAENYFLKKMTQNYSGDLVEFYDAQQRSESYII